MAAPEQPAAARPGTTPFLGFDFDPLDLDGAAAWLSARGPGDEFGYVVTPNVDHVVCADREPELYRPLWRGAALCLCDSRVLSRVARACGVRLPVAPGSDLTRRLFEDVARPGDRVCVVGAGEEAVARLRVRYPALELLHCPAPMGLRGDPDALARTASDAVRIGRGARAWVLAVGMPQQEMLAARMAALPGAAGTALCVGASVDFLTGDQRRAPRVVQRAGMEWAWRLALHPRRLARRYLVDGPAVFPLAWRWARARRRSVSP